MDTPIQWWRSHGWGARILVILALLYVLYALAVFLILPGWLRDDIETRLSDTLGRDVTLQELRLNPLTLSITAEQFEVADPDTGFLARFDRLYVNTAFWASLFHWRPWVSDVDLAGLQIRLRRGEDGALNLDDIITRLRERGEGDASESDGQAAQDEPSGPPAFTISHLRLSEGRVTLNDVSGSEPASLSLPVAFSIEDLTTRGVDEEDNLYRLYVEGPDGGTLDWQGRFVFEPLTVDGRLQMEKVDVTAFTRLLEPHFPFQVPSGVLALAADYRYATESGEGLTVRNGRFQLEQLRILRDGNEDPSFTVPALSVSGVSLNLTELRVNVPEVVLTEPRMRAVLTDQGLDLATLFLPSDPERAREAREEVREEADQSVERIRQGEAWAVTLDQFRVENGSVLFRDQTLPEPAEVTLTEGALSLTDIRVDDNLTWQWEGSAVLAESGRLSHSGSGQLAPLEVSADLDLGDLPLTVLSPWLADAVPLSIEQGRASGDMTLTVAGEAADITLTGRASVADVRLRESDRELLNVASLGADGVSVKSANRLVTVDGLAGHGIDFRHLLDEQGRSLGTRLFGEDGDEDGPGWRVVLGRVSVDKSRLAHRDNTLSPDFEVSLEQWSGVMEGFDTGSGRASLETSGRVNGQARLRAQGDLSVDPLYLDITGQLDGYGMESLTPFTTRYLGFGVERGRLDVDTKVLIQHGQLDSTTKIAADKFYLGDRVESDQAVDAPVKLGLSVLRDSSGMIRLPVTVSGDLNDPGFSTGGVVLRVIRNVLVKAATAPFSMLASLAGGGEADLQYLPFPAGDAQPGAGTRDKMARLADILKDRNNLAVVLTGQTSGEDRRALGEAEVIDDLSGDWPGLDAALTGERWRERILDTYEDRTNLDRDTLEGDNPSDQAREAWRRMLETAAAEVDGDSLLALARERGQQARRQLLEAHGLPEQQVRLGDPRVDGDVTGVGLGVGDT